MDLTVYKKKLKEDIKKNETQYIQILKSVMSTDCLYNKGDEYNDEDGCFIIENIEPIKELDYIIGYRYDLVRKKEEL